MIKTKNTSLNHNIENRLIFERENGYPSFKNAIRDALVKEHHIDVSESERIVYSPEMHEIIISDVAWAQHMGPEYMAEVAAYRWNLR